MKLIVGLGNPGEIYAHTRHNIGFTVLRALADRCGVSLKKDNSTFSLTAKARLGQENVILALPLTFMNLSGIATNALLKKYRIDLDKVLVVCDDLDLAFGRLRIRPNGSSGGHRGIQSIIDYIRSNEFARLRLGIGRPHPRVDAADFVLSGFKKKEKQELESIVQDAAECSLVWAAKGVTEAMNIFNRRSNDE